MTGYTQGELLKMSLDDLVSSPPEMVAKRAAAIRANGSLRFEGLLLCKDGRELNVETSARYITAYNQIACFVRNIAARVSMRASVDALLGAEKRPDLRVIWNQHYGENREGAVVEGNDTHTHRNRYARLAA